VSTYYYLVCEEHKVVSEVIGGRSFPARWWSNDNGELERFLEAHGDCKPAPLLLNEYDDRTFEYPEIPSRVPTDSTRKDDDGE
jgi:hypothetical protein